LVGVFLVVVEVFLRSSWTVADAPLQLLDIGTQQYLLASVPCLRDHAALCNSVHLALPAQRMAVQQHMCCVCTSPVPQVRLYEMESSSDYRLNYRLAKSCRADIDKICGDVCPQDDGTVSRMQMASCRVGWMERCSHGDPPLLNRLFAN
jgi:hypothetical protein